MGLSIANMLARRGVKVMVIDRGAPGREASWAGAGILPPATTVKAHHPLDRLRALSFDLHREWAETLRSETGIDTGYRICGGLYLARSPGESAALIASKDIWTDESIQVESWTAATLKDRIPGLKRLSLDPSLRQLLWLPGESQLRNPRHLQALIASNQRHGVSMATNQRVLSVATIGSRAIGVETEMEMLEADRICLAAGPWTYELLSQLGIQTGLLPMRGQMLLFRLPRPIFECVINEGSRYIVPRDDGHVLVGSTEEETGFDKSITDSAKDDLMKLAASLSDQFNDATLVDHWAGLRPATFDGFPYMGSVPGIDQLYVAAGHFRSGLFLSTGTAAVMSELMLDGASSIDLSPFRISRK